MDSNLPAVRLPNGDTIELPASARSDLRSILLFAVPKTGGTLLARLIDPLAAIARMPFVRLSNKLFSRGYMEYGEHLRALGLGVLFRPTGYIYGLFRQYPVGFGIADVAAYRQILLVRDPRDILVSDYYSIAFSHQLPRGDAAEQFQRWREETRERTIDNFVLSRIPGFKARFEQYLENLDLDAIHLFRYEDYIYKKKEWVGQLAQLIGQPVDDDTAARIAAEQDIFPDSEHIGSHVRQVHPGNYRSQLQRRTIERIDAEFGSIMALFGYRRDGD